MAIARITEDHPNGLGRPANSPWMSKPNAGIRLFFGGNLKEKITNSPRSDLNRKETCKMAVMRASAASTCGAKLGALSGIMAIATARP